MEEFMALSALGGVTANKHVCGKLVGVNSKNNVASVLVARQLRRRSAAQGLLAAMTPRFGSWASTQYV